MTPRARVIEINSFNRFMSPQLYASEVKEFSAVDMRRCHVALNNAIRKVFSYAVWQSIRDLRKSYGYKCIYEIFASTKAKFMANASSSSNLIVSHLATPSNI